MRQCGHVYQGKGRAKCGRRCRGERCARHQRQWASKENRRKAWQWDEALNMIRDGRFSAEYLTRWMLESDKVLAAAPRPKGGAK